MATFFPSRVLRISSSSGCVLSAGVIALAILSADPVSGTVIYNEASSADLSNSGLAPTVLTVGPGQNQVFGTTGRGANGTDRDYFTFTVPNGFAITSIVVLPGTTTGGDVSFIGVEAGTQITLPTNASDATGLLGWKHYSANNGN